jgi:TATA-binding protein-associated factor Taf7
MGEDEDDEDDDDGEDEDDDDEVEDGRWKMLKMLKMLSMLMKSSTVHRSRSDEILLHVISSYGVNPVILSHEN